MITEALGQNIFFQFQVTENLLQVLLKVYANYLSSDILLFKQSYLSPSPIVVGRFASGCDRSSCRCLNALAQQGLSPGTTSKEIKVGVNCIDNL